MKMINVGRFDIFKMKVEAIVIPVNCIGVMGAGLAKKFAKLYPDGLQKYQMLCCTGTMRPGVVRSHRLRVQDDGKMPTHAVFFPTKDDWRNPSKIQWIDDGLIRLKYEIIYGGFNSIAIPALGCGLGGLQFEDVRAAIYRYLQDLDGVDIHVSKPAETRGNR
jgi:O-acetyl-ADP-ribose deacetylase (regulator of RNase III)